MEDVIQEAEIAHGFSTAPGLFCRVYGICKTDSAAWILMDLILKGDLSNFLAEDSEPFPLHIQIEYCLSAA